MISTRIISSSWRVSLWSSLRSDNYNQSFTNTNIRFPVCSNINIPEQTFWLSYFILFTFSSLFSVLLSFHTFLCSLLSPLISSKLPPQFPVSRPSRCDWAACGETWASEAGACSVFWDVSQDKDTLAGGERADVQQQRRRDFCRRGRAERR